MLVPSAANRTLATSGVMDEAEYTIDPGEIAHLMWVLRTGLYTRKALAVLREYSANAWDAMRMVGKGDQPIKVVVPTYSKPEVRIRDYGPGLSKRDTLRVYTAYGKSTKRGAEPHCGVCYDLNRDYLDKHGIMFEAPSGLGQVPPDDRQFCLSCAEAHERAQKEVGALGIGSKSGFCIGDSFTVTSWHGGYKRIYSAALDETNKGKMMLLHEEECGDETGIEVKVPVPAELIEEFRREARDLFRFMVPRPEVNIDLPDLPEGLENGWIVDEDHGHEWIGVMGCIPYRLDIDALTEGLREEGIYDALSKLSGGIYIPIGGVDFAANRESLQYTKGTKATLVAALKALLEDYFESCLAALDDETLSGWDRRARGLFLVKRLAFPVPKKYDSWTSERVFLYAKEKGEKPKTFRLTNAKGESTLSIPVNSDTTVLFNDDPLSRSLKGWQLHRNDVVATPINDATVEDVKEELEEVLKAKHCDGAKVASLSGSRHWQSLNTSSGRSSTYNAKHRERVFKLTGTDTYVNALSKNWTITEPPDDSHVYFIINAFKVKGSTNFYQKINEDRVLARRLGIPFPDDIYGYKTTQAKPVKDSDIESGTPYMEWRKTYFAKQITAARRDLMRVRTWSQVFSDVPWEYSQNEHKDGKWEPNALNWRAHKAGVLKQIARDLGAKHSLTRMMLKPYEARKQWRALDAKERGAVDSLVSFMDSTNRRSASQAHFDRLVKAYPMLGFLFNEPDDLVGIIKDPNTVIAYIKMMDGAQK